VDTQNNETNVTSHNRRRRYRIPSHGDRRHQYRVRGLASRPDHVYLKKVGLYEISLGTFRRHEHGCLTALHRHHITRTQLYVCTVQIGILWTRSANSVCFCVLIDRTGLIVGLCFLFLVILPLLVLVSFCGYRHRVSLLAYYHNHIATRLANSR